MVVRVKLKDGTPLKDACSSPEEYARVYSFMLKHKINPDEALITWRGKYGEQDIDGRTKVERRTNVLIRNLQTQLDVFFNQFCRLDEMANQEGDDRGMLLRLRKEIRQTVMTIFNIGETNRK